MSTGINKSTYLSVRIDKMQVFVVPPVGQNKMKSIVQVTVGGKTHKRISTLRSDEEYPTTY